MLFVSLNINILNNLFHIVRCILFSTSAIWLPDNRYNETNSKSLFPINYFDQHPSWYIIENIPFTLYPFLFLPVMLHWIRVFVLSRAIEKSVYDTARNATISITVMIFIALNCFYLCQFAVPNNRIYIFNIMYIYNNRRNKIYFRQICFSYTVIYYSCHNPYLFVFRSSIKNSNWKCSN